MPDLGFPDVGPLGVGPLDVDADLLVHVEDGLGRRSTAARITGRGDVLTVRADDPVALWSAVSPSDVGRAADLLAACGLVARVHGPDGVVATVGAGVTNPAGRAVTGSPHVAPAPRAVWGAVRARWSVTPVPVRVLAAAVPALLVWGVAGLARLARRGRN